MTTVKKILVTPDRTVFFELKGFPISQGRHWKLFKGRHKDHIFSHFANMTKKSFKILTFSLGLAKVFSRLSKKTVTRQKKQSAMA